MTATLRRPDGRLYIPRRTSLRAAAWENPEADAGVVVLGTMDAERAQPFALESAIYWYGPGEVVSPRPGWWRDGFLWGERCWVEDEGRGAPGVMFTWEER